MIAIDTQILTYAHRPETQWHVQSKRCLTELAGGGSRWAIPMHCLVEFYANVTNLKMYKPASTVLTAIDQIDAWLESPTLVVLSEDTQTWQVARDLLIGAKIVGAAAYDARIAAVCLQHGVSELWTNDRDFLRFPSLRTRNPLIEPTGAAEPRALYRTTPTRHEPSTRPRRANTSRRAHG